MAVASTPIRRSGAAQLPYSAEFLWLPRYIKRAHSVPVGRTAEAEKGHRPVSWFHLN